MDPKQIENWKTTVGGIMTALGMLGMVLPPPVRGIFMIIGSIGAVMTGVNAKDFNTHSTQAQVDKATQQSKEAI